MVPTSDHYTWNVAVEADDDQQDIVLAWNPAAWGNHGAALLLYDPQAQIMLDMKRINHYTIEKANRRDLKIFYGRDEDSLLPDVTGLGQIFPNQVIDHATIPFITSEGNEFVEIELFDMMGKKVKTLVSGRFDPGYHETGWDGTDCENGPIPSGLYFYHMTSNGRLIGQARRIIKTN